MKPLANDSFPCNGEIKGYSAKISLERGNKLDRDLKFSFQQSQLLKRRLRTTSSMEVHIFSIQSNGVIKAAAPEDNTALLLNDTRRILEGKDPRNGRVKHLRYALQIPNIFSELYNFLA